jgi:hypothetical protein
MFLDDMINDDPNKAEWLIRIKSETGIPLEWVSYARWDVIKTEAQAQKLLDAGCRGIYFGIESMKTEVGPMIGKITDREKILKGLHLVRKVFGDSALIKVSMIGGLPGETAEEFKESIDWMLRTEEGQYLIDRVSMTPLVIYRQDKGDLTASRNHPFAKYEVDEQQLKDFSAASDWKSPWGTRAFFGKLIGQLYHGVNPVFHQAHPFYFPMYHSFGVSLKDYVSSYRDRSHTFNLLPHEIQQKAKEFISLYKSRMLSLTPEQVDEGHNEFWASFPVRISTLQNNYQVIEFFKK